MIGGSILCAVSMHSAAQFQAEPPAAKPVKNAPAVRAASPVTKTSTKVSVVYAPTSEVTRKFISETMFFNLTTHNLDAATFLLQQGADINCQACLDTIRNSGRTLLMKTAGSQTQSGNLDPLLPWLVNNGANAKLTDASGNTVMHHIFSPFSDFDYWPGLRGNLRFVLGLGVDINAKNDDGNTAIHIFAKNSRLYAESKIGDIADYASVIAELVKGGAKIDEKNIAGRTPLMMSLEQCSLPIAKAYLRAGASANTKDAAGQGLLEVARARAIQSPEKKCIEVANFFGNPQNVEALNVSSLPMVPEGMSPSLAPPTGINFPSSLVANFEGSIKSSLQEKPFSAKGKIDADGNFEYNGDNGVVMKGVLDASSSEIIGRGITVLPKFAGKQITYSNGESQSDVVLLAKFDGRIFRGSYMSKFERGTFSLCVQGVTAAECTVPPDPLGSLLRGLGSLLSK